MKEQIRKTKNCAKHCVFKRKLYKRSGAKHSPLSFASKILGDPKGCSRASNIWYVFLSSMLNLKIILQTIFNILQIHFSYDNVLWFYRFDFENANENLKKRGRNVKNEKSFFFQITKLVTFKTEIKQKHISRCVRRIQMI